MSAVDSEATPTLEVAEAQTAQEERRRPVSDIPQKVGRQRRPSLFGGLGLLVSAVGFLVGSRVITDNSFLTHLATGRYIIETGSVPSVDVYSATALGEPWTVQSWLPSLIYAGLADTVGDPGIRLFNGLLTLLVMAGIWRLLSPAKSVIVRLALAAVPLIIGAEIWGPRPLLVGLLGIVVVLDFLLNARNPVWLLPVMWIWVNSHGSFPLAGLLAVTYGIGQWLDSRTVPVKSVRVLAWISGGTLLGMVGPLGWRVLWFPIQLLRDSAALEGVTEWSAPSFKTASQLLFAGLVAGAVALGTRKTSWSFVIPAAVFMVSGLLAVRSISTASIVMVVLAAPYLASYSGGISGESRGILPTAVGLLGGAVLALVVVSVSAEGALRLDAYPVDEVAWLDDRDLVANPEINLIHREFVGNYLDLRYGSDARVFVDDRFDMFPSAVLEDHRNLIRGIAAREILDRRSAEVLLWETGTPLEGLIHEATDWSVVYEGDDWFIACRTALRACSDG